MMEEWKEYNITDAPKVPLTELLEFIVDNRGKTVPTSEKGIALIATNCIKNENLFPLYEKIRFVSPYTYNTWFRSHPYPGDIIFVNKGTPGRTALVPDPVDFCIAQDMMAFRVKKTLIYNKYLLAILRSRHIQQFISNSQVGTIIPHFKKEQLKSLLIPLPIMDVQKRIGDLYYLLSVKIENNRRININLEQQAQALFKSWFVDFEPFKDGEFVESELGRIPKGWRVGTLEELGDIVGGSTPSKAKPEYYTDKGIAWLTPKDLSLSNAKFTARGKQDITQEGYDSCSTKLMPKGTVLFSSRAPIGYITIAKNDICTNQGFKSVVPNYAGTAFLYCYLRSSTQEIENKATGSTFKEASGALMKSLQVVVAPKEIMDDFERQMEPLFDEQECVEDESRHLSTLRDTLLPRLMSGELHVKDIERSAI